MKYKEWLHDWLELYEKESVKPKTYKQYEDVINRRSVQTFSEYELYSIKDICFSLVSIFMDKLMSQL